MQTSNLNPSLHEIMNHTNEDYPVGVYYVEPAKMYMNYVRWHWHEEFEIDLVKDGTAEYTIGDEKVTVYEGQAIFINRNVLHSIHSVNNDNCIILSLLFHPHFLFSKEDSSLFTGYIKAVEEDPELKYMIFDKKDIRNRSVLSYLSDILDANFSQEFGYELVTKSSLCQIWLVLTKKIKHRAEPVTKKERALSPDEIRIKDAITYIEQHYFESITLDDIAASIHVSKSECCRCFKRAVSLTPFEYLMRYRILRAADKILQNDREMSSISELAASVGFNNTSYFNKLFKKYFNCTPTEYRKLSKIEHRDQLSPFGLSLTHI